MPDNSGSVTDGRCLAGPYLTCGVVASGVEIRVPPPSAGCVHARKGSTGTQASRAALVTSLAGPGRVVLLEREPGSLGLVGRESLEFSKRPARHHSVPVLVPGSRALANTFQVLHADDAESTVQGLLDDVLRNVVVHPGDVPPLPAGQASQEPLGSSRAFALERCAYPSIPGLDDLNRLPGDPPSCGHGRDVREPKIDTKCQPFESLGYGLIDRDVNKPTSIGLDDPGARGVLAGQSLTLVTPDIKDEPGSAVERGDRDSLVFLAVLEDSLVEVEARGPERLDGFLALRSNLDRGRDPGDRANSEIGREACASADIAVRCVVQLVLVRGLKPLRHVKYIVASNSKRVGRSQQRICLSGIGSHQAPDRSLHGQILPQFHGGALPPRGLKPRGFRAEDL